MMGRPCSAIGAIFRRRWPGSIRTQVFNLQQTRSKFKPQRTQSLTGDACPTGFMRLTIDNLRGAGPADYTAAVDGTSAPQVVRKINQPSELRFGLVANATAFVVPVTGARVMLARADGSFVFTGYLTQGPQCEYLGWGEQGPVYRYEVIAESDEVMLDDKALPNRARFVNRSAGSALRQLVQDLLPGCFDTSAVQDVDTLAVYTVNPQKKFTYHAAEIALAARASYRAMNGALALAPVGAAAYAINESDANFSPMGLKLVAVPESAGQRCDGDWVG